MKISMVIIKIRTSAHDEVLRLARFEICELGSSSQKNMSLSIYYQVKRVNDKHVIELSDPHSMNFCGIRQRY